MKNFIPNLIAQKQSVGIGSDTFSAFTMFIDISGFTSMTQTLMGHGKEGSEILSNIINNIFTPAIKAIYDNKGFVSTFAGDAFTAIFETEMAECSLKAAFEINKLFVDSGIVKTKFGDFELAVKIGLSHGEVEFGIIDAEVQKAYYFRGEAIDACAKSEHHAEKMMIAADRKFVEKLSVQVEKQPKEKNWFILTPKVLDLSPIERKPGFEIPEEIEKHFVPDAVLNMKDRGEFREIVSVFIGFEESDGYIESIKQVIKNTHAYGGYFNKIDFGDKGGVMLVIFGAPTGREKLYSRAADFALSLKQMRDLKFRTGISTGIAFCGIVGSELRKEYTALGNVVNLSARLMMKTEPQQILTGPGITAKLPAQYELDNKGLTEFKGFHDKIEIFSLRNKTANKQQLSYSGSFVGRKKEAEELRKLIQPIYEDKFGGIIYIDGPAGIGKSRFIDNFVKNLDDCASFYLPCDEVLRKSFNPFEYFFKNYFEHSESLSKEDNKALFSNKYAELVSQVKDEEIKNELIRTESVIGALIGLEWENSLYSQLDAKGKYENTLFAVKNFFLAQSLLEPVILIIEDARWIDPDSLVLIKVLTRNVDKFPFVILALCRPNDDGTPYSLIGNEETEMPLSRFKIDPLNKKMMNELIRDRFSNEEIPENTLEFMRDKSNGNPFFIEQLVLYLSENNLLDSTLNLVNEARFIPSGISQIIIARIDRLSAKMKETVKTASVLGREFTLAVLRKMLSSGNIDPGVEINTLVSEGIKEQIWQNIKELSYIFKNSLIRDTVYEIQLKETLRSLHELAGNIIEELYFGEINQYCEELADHFDKAGNRVKAVEYLKKAASRAMDNYQNEKALILFGKLLVYLDEGSEDTVRTLRKIGDILELTGKWEESLNTFRKAFEVAETGSYTELKIECLTDLSYLLNTQGKSDEAYELATQAIETAEKISYENGSANALNVLGSIYLNKGDHSASINTFIRSSEIKEKLGDKKGVATALGNIGAVYSSKGDFDKSLEFFTRQKKLSKEISDKLLYSRAVGNMGVAYYYKGDYSKAVECYQKDLEVRKELGDKRGISVIIGNLGSVFLNRGLYNEAIENYGQCIEIKKELGDKRGISTFTGNMGIAYTELGEFEKAVESYSLSISTANELNYTRQVSISTGNLANAYREIGMFQDAIECYDKAIKMATELGINYFLSGNLFCKADLMFDLSRYEEAEILNGLAFKSAEETKREDIIFKSKILSYKLKHDEISLQKIPNSGSTDDDQTADIYYELWKMTGKTDYKNKAFENYKFLSNKSQKYEYRKRIEEMEKSKP